MFVIDYNSLILPFVAVNFFVLAARIERRSPLLWGGLSLAVWLVWRGLLPQFGVCLAMTAAAFVRDGEVPWRTRS